MKVVYLIVAHKQFDLLAQIIKALKHPDIDIIIFFDKKADVDISEFENTVGENENVFYLEERININWGGFSFLLALIKLLEAALSFNKYDYLSFISGQDYPIKSNAFILNYLNANRGMDFIEHFSVPRTDGEWGSLGGAERFECFWLIDQLGFNDSYDFCKKQKAENIKRIVPENLALYGGSNWMTITRACGQFIIAYLKNNPHVLNFFKHVFIPEEMLFQTIVLNSDFKGRVINDNLRFIDWKHNGPKPKVLGMEDFDRLIKSSSHFARKFDLTVDAEIINTLKKIR